MEQVDINIIEKKKSIIDEIINRIKNDNNLKDKLNGIITYKPDGINTKQISLEEFLRNEFIKGVSVNSNVDSLYADIVSRAIPYVKVVKQTNNIDSKKEKIEEFIYKIHPELTSDYKDYFLSTIYNNMNDDYSFNLANKIYTLDSFYEVIKNNIEEENKVNDKQLQEESIIETINYYLDEIYTNELDVLDSILESGITYREYLIEDLKSKMINQTEIMVEDRILRIDDQINMIHEFDMELINRDSEQPDLISQMIIADGEYSTEELQKLSDKEGYTLYSNITKKENSIDNFLLYMNSKDAIINSRDSETIDNILNNIVGVEIFSPEQINNLNELADKKKMQLTKINMNKDELIVDIEGRNDTLVGMLNREIDDYKKSFIQKSIYDLQDSIASLPESIPKDISDNIDSVNEKLSNNSILNRVTNFVNPKEYEAMHFTINIDNDILVVGQLKNDISEEINPYNTGLKVKLDNLVKNIYDKLENAKVNGIINDDEYNKYLDKIESKLGIKENKRTVA